MIKMEAVTEQAEEIRRSRWRQKKESVMIVWEG